MKRIIFGLLTSILLFAFVENCEAQMEKRVTALYRYHAFLKSAPAIGSEAPTLSLKTLDGAEADLTDYRGKPLVIVKGSYT